jgi:hypothetical protein
MEDMIDLINQVSEFADIHDFVRDDSLDEAMAAIVKIISKPDIPPTQAITLIAKLQAISAKFGILAAWYSTAAKGPTGSPNNIKKNIYYSTKDALDKLVDSLKYIVRYNLG